MMPSKVEQWLVESFLERALVQHNGSPLERRRLACVNIEAYSGANLWLFEPAMILLKTWYAARVICHFFPRWRRTTAAGLVFALTSIGCGRIGQRPPRNQDQLIRIVPVETVTEGAIAQIAQRGTQLAIEVSRVCELRTDRVVQRTTQVDSYNESPARDWWLAGAALAAAGVGTGLLVDTSNTYPDDPTSRTYNPVGPEKQRDTGYAFVGLGGVFATTVIVDAVRASSTETTSGEVTITGAVETHAAPCKGRPYADVQVTGELNQRTFLLGSTNALGQLHVDLDQAASDDLLLTPATARLALQVNGHVAGSADLAPLYLSREARAFARSDEATCLSAVSIQACEPTEQFFARYPDGPHAARARQTLDAAAPKLSALRDEKSWSAARAEMCTNAVVTASDPESLMSACEPLQDYFREFPSGSHASEARGALEKVTARADELSAKRAQAEAAAEAKAAAAALSRAPSDAKIRQILIQDSISSYGGSCPCPYNSARNGSSCGRRSAYSRPGGASPLCYPRDVTPEMIQEYRRSTQWGN